jgi:hypothetical protein
LGPSEIDGWTDADGRPQLRIRNGVDPNITIGIDWPLDLSYRPWEIAVAAVAALMKELSSPPSLRVEVIAMPEIRTVAVQPETPASPSPLPEDQIQALMGDVSELSELQKKIRRYAVLKYGTQWGNHDPAEVQKNARGDPLYKKEVGDIDYHITTFRRALGRKKSDVH